MPQLKELQKKIPSADAVAGRVIAFHEGKHYDLGQYMGEGVVVLSPEGVKLLSPKKAQQKPAEFKGVDLDDLSAIEL